MPTFQVEDSATGRVFHLDGDSPPSEDELQGIFAQGQDIKPQESPNVPFLNRTGQNLSKGFTNVPEQRLSSDLPFAAQPFSSTLTPARQDTPIPNFATHGERAPTYLQSLNKVFTLSPADLMDEPSGSGAIAGAHGAMYGLAKQVNPENALMLTGIGEVFKAARAGSVLANLAKAYILTHFAKSGAEQLGTSFGQTAGGEGPQNTGEAGEAAVNNMMALGMMGGPFGMMGARRAAFEPQILPTEIHPSTADINAGRIPPENQLPFRTYTPPDLLNPNGGARFAVNAQGQGVDLSQLSPQEQVELMRGPREFIPRTQNVREAQQSPFVLGQQVEPSQIIDPSQGNPSGQPLIVGQGFAGEPKQGGQISFEGVAGGIPNARQSAVKPLPLDENIQTQETQGEQGGLVSQETPQATQVQTYKELVDRLKVANPQQQQIIWQQLENLKNQNQGLPPVEQTSSLPPVNKEAGLVNDVGDTLSLPKTEPTRGETPIEQRGSKGEVVELGRHKNSLQEVQDQYGHKVWTERNDLIFRNADGTPKTTVSGRMYPLKDVKEDFSYTGKDKAQSKVNAPAEQVSAKGLQIKLGNEQESGGPHITKAIIDAFESAFKKVGEGVESIKDVFSDENFRRVVNKTSGVSLPNTTAINDKVGNQLAMFANAEAISSRVAQSMATDVLGSKWKDKDFDQQLGAVGVEDRLRAIGSGNTIVSKQGSPFKTEQDYRKALNNPDIQAALQRHKTSVQPLAERLHTQLGGKLSVAGKETGAFFNLIADEHNEVRSKGSGLTGTLKKGTAFGREFKGTAEGYEYSYRKMAERMVKGESRGSSNWVENEKQKLYKMVADTGFGFIQKAGDELPNFDREMEAIPIQRRVVVSTKPGTPAKVFNQNETLWVPRTAAGEFTQAFQTDSPLRGKVVKGIGHAITTIQTSLGADAIFHIGNQVASIVTAPEKLTAIKYTLANMVKVWENSPDLQRELAHIAKEHGIARESDVAVDKNILQKILQPGGGLIKYFDKVGRLTFNQLYSDAVARGESPDSSTWRRANVQSQLGEYNKRMGTKTQQVLKELGISPFITAGKTFNKLSLKQLTLSPNRKASNPLMGAKMRGKQALYVGGLVLALPMAVNMATTGNPFGRPGVKTGMIDTGKTGEDGRPIVVDVAQLMMLRRGMRVSGADAVVKGVKEGQPWKRIVSNAASDIGKGVVAPYAGPMVNMGSMLTTGSDVLGYHKAIPSNRLTEATKALNPVTETLFSSDEEAPLGERAIGKFGRVVGLKLGDFPTREDKEQGMTLKERARVQLGEKTTKAPMNVNKQYGSSINAITQKFENDEALKKTMPPPVQEMLKKNRLEFRGYDHVVSVPDVLVKGESKTLGVRLTPKEQQSLDGLMQKHYTQMLSSLAQREKVTQQLLDERISQARKKAEKEWRGQYNQSLSTPTR